MRTVKEIEHDADLSYQKEKWEKKDWINCVMLKVIDGKNLVGLTDENIQCLDKALNKLSAQQISLLNSGITGYSRLTRNLV